MTVKEVAAFLRAHDSYLILTHRRPDGDTLGCAAALCAMLRQMGKTAALLPNAEVTSLYADYVAPYWAAEDYRYETVVSVDLAALGLFPDNAERFKNRVDLAIDHHPSYEGFGRESCVHPECAACGEILYELAVELGQLTPAVALPLYVAVSTDTGCFVYSNVTANTHRVAAALMETGIDYRAANKRHFRTKTKKRLALEAELLRTMEFYDEGRVVVVTLPLSLAERLSLTEADMDDVSALGGVVEGTDCSITMKETKDGAWKISVRTGARVNATKACAALGGGGHRAASGCVYHGPLAEAKAAILAAGQAAVEEQRAVPPCGETLERRKRAECLAQRRRDLCRTAFLSSTSPPAGRAWTCAPSCAVSCAKSASVTRERSTPWRPASCPCLWAARPKRCSLPKTGERNITPF